MSVIAPITGRFRRRIVRDIVGSITVGTLLSSAWFYGYSRPKLARFKAHDAKVREETLAEAQEWFAEKNYTK